MLPPCHNAWKLPERKTSITKKVTTEERPEVNARET
jgi:hypothetical protein